MNTTLGLRVSALSIAVICGTMVGQAATDVTLEAPRYGAWGFDLSGQDERTKSGDDFYRYSQGVAVDRLRIPADRSSYGNYEALEELSQRRVHAIVESAAAAHAPLSSVEGKIGAFYTAFMDEKRVEALGTQAVEPDLERVRNATSRSELAALMGHANHGVTSSLFGVEIHPDAKDPTHYSVYLGQGGLGLPDRDYYLQRQFADQKTAYLDYVTRMLTYAHWANPAASARAVVDFETAIAAASWSRERAREVDRIYNPTSVAALQVAAPGFPWQPFLQAADLGHVTRVVVREKTAVPRLAALYATSPVETLRAWQAFHVIDNAAPLLSQELVSAHFALFDRMLSGQPQIEARWKRAVDTVSTGMGEAIGALYVARYFPPDSKDKAQALVAHLLTAFRGRLEKLEWMGAATKAEALRKLARYTVEIGYPSKWREYSGLEIREDDLLGNVRRCAAFNWAYQVSHIDKPVDRDEWTMTPQAVDAYNDPFLNAIVFPAAVLQPPFFDPNADAAINYGGIGAVIGHEITHGFDDQGRKIDSKGRLRDWWTAQDAQRFKEQARKLGLQYSQFEPLPGVHVNGELTMGENIADLGGFTVALDAYRESLQGKPAPVIDGFTGEQRVFLGWAQVWGGKKLPEQIRKQVLVDEHSPWELRTNGVVRNIDAWYTAFNVGSAGKLYVSPQERVRIW